MVEADPDGKPMQIHLILNWVEELNTRVPRRDDGRSRACEVARIAQLDVRMAGNRVDSSARQPLGGKRPDKPKTD